MRNAILFLTILCVCFTSNANAQTCYPVRQTRQGLMYRLFRQPSYTYSQPRRVQYYYPSSVTYPAATHAIPSAPAIFSPAGVVANSSSSTSAAVPVEATPLAPTPAEAVPADISAIPAEPTPAEPEKSASSESEWVSLFDGKELGEWKATAFGGEGNVDVEDGQIKCDFGQYMTGVTHSGKDIPTNNYEVELEVMREDGSDFFCGLTFPVDKSHASFIVGGWGGSVVGISSIDDMDASENSTTGYKVFKNKEWYKVRVRVTPNRLQAWINDSQFVDEEVDGERLSTRIEVDRCKPLGVCCFDTQAAYKNIRIRKVTEPAKK